MSAVESAASARREAIFPKRSEWAPAAESESDPTRRTDQGNVAAVFC